MTETVPLIHTPFGERESDAVVLTDAIVKDPVTVINAFTVPAGKADLFLERWRVGVGVMAAQPGFVQARMLRALDSSAELNFVTVAQWASGEALAQARKNPKWQASVKRMIEEVQPNPRPMIYQPALVVNPGETP